MCEHSLCDSTLSVRITKSTPEKSTSVLGPDVAEHQKYENYHEKWTYNTEKYENYHEKWTYNTEKDENYHEKWTYNTEKDENYHEKWTSKKLNRQKG